MLDIVATVADVNTETTPALPNCRSWQDYAELINGTWRKSAEAFFITGQYLIEAKEELTRDEYSALLKLRLDFDTSTAKKLICIAHNRILGAHVHRLPPCWSTIYELTKLEDDALRAAFSEAKISPKMMRKDAIALRKPSKDKAGESEKSTEPSAQPELLEYWQMATADEQRAVLKHHGVDGVLELLKDDLSELYDRVIGLQVALASPVVASKSSKKLLTNLTGTLHWALGQDDPASGAQALKIIRAKLAANKRDPKDVCFSFAKNARR